MGVSSLKTSTTQDQPMDEASAVALDAPNGLAGTITRWARERGIRRLRSDRRVGYPDEACVVRWSLILEQWRVGDSDHIFAVLDAALSAATRSGEWRNWAFLTLQVQLAAERLPMPLSTPLSSTTPPCDLSDEDPACDWAVAKREIRNRVGEIPFANWFGRTRQIARWDTQITIAVPDETSRCFLETEYGDLLQYVLGEFGIETLRFIVTNEESKLS